jgi:hypothetical protein
LLITFPPVLPVIFYDGPEKWTSEINFYNKTAMNDIFEKYIPKFEYELINLNDYEETELVKFGDVLSLIMIIDKIRTSSGMSLLKHLPADYIEKLALKIPDRLNKLLADVITVLLNRINVPKEEIEEITDYIYQRRTQEMFEFFEDYDVQETRRIARAEGKAEGKVEGKAEGKAEEKAASKAALLQTAQKLKALGLSNSTISDTTGLSLNEIEQL